VESGVIVHIKIIARWRERHARDIKAISNLSFKDPPRWRERHARDIKAISNLSFKDPSYLSVSLYYQF